MPPAGEAARYPAAGIAKFQRGPEFGMAPEGLPEARQEHLFPGGHTGPLGPLVSAGAAPPRQEC